MRKTDVLMTNPEVRKYIPKSVWLTSENVITMLQEFPFVFIKPDKGGGGGGAIQVRRKGYGLYECKTLYKSELVDQRRLTDWIRKNCKKDHRYMVQRGIQLAQTNNQIFDLRISLHKPADEWKITGIVSKIAPKGKFITNHCKGGKPAYIQDVLYPLFKGDQRRVYRCLREIQKLSINVAHTLNNKFKGLRELGIDLGIDVNHQMWIFEVNTKPCPLMFKHLPDRTMYRYIMKCHSQIMNRSKL